MKCLNKFSIVQMDSICSSKLSQKGDSVESISNSFYLEINFT